MKPQCMAPDAAMIVLEAQVPTKLYTAANKYRPTAMVHHANDALIVWSWKQVAGTSRHARTEAL